MNSTQNYKNAHNVFTFLKCRDIINTQKIYIKECFTMNNPTRCRYKVFGTEYYLQVDTKKSDCNGEPAHCHVYDGNGNNIAKIRLPDCTFENEPEDMHQLDKFKIISIAEEYCEDLCMIYTHNAICGSEG